MGIRAHIETKRVIEYSHGCLNWQRDEILDWLQDNGVEVYSTTGECASDSSEWEIDKTSLRAIPAEAYQPLNEGEDNEISADTLRDFVKELLESPADETYAYVSWF